MIFMTEKSDTRRNVRDAGNRYIFFEHKTFSRQYTYVQRFGLMVIIIVTVGQ